MHKFEPPTDTTDLSVDFITELLRDFRNTIIKGLLVDENLIHYVNRRYHVQLTPVKIAFLKKELQELSLTAIDLVHYSKMITEMKDTVTITSDTLFHDELHPIFKKYCN